MINIELVTAKLELEDRVKSLELYLAQKEVVEYTAWKNKPENEKDRSAYEKVVTQLKLNDEEWLNLEEDLLEHKRAYKKVSTIYSILFDMVRGVGRENGITLEYFRAIQDEYMELLK